jgi:uncharacterized protein
VAAEIARTARLVLTYKGVNIAEHAVRAEYTDHARGTQDELSCTLEDRERRWQGPWFPGKGERVEATIICLDWRKAGQTMRLLCGTFEIGEVSLSGPPDMVEIRAVSARITRTARTQKKSKPWEAVDLKAIAAHVAGRAGLSLVFDGNSPVYVRVDQREESDLAFLLRLCTDAGNGVKARDGKLIVYSEAAYDAKPVTLTIERGAEWIIDYRIDTSSHDIYRSAVATYWHHDRKELLLAEFTPPDAPESGEILRCNKPVESASEAMALARNALRAKNRVEVTADFTLVGDPLRQAMQVVRVKGFGIFDGEYSVDEARHQIDSTGGYTTGLNLRKVLKY